MFKIVTKEAPDNVRGDIAPLEVAIDDPVTALVLLVEACERGEKNLRPYLDASHKVIERST